MITVGRACLLLLIFVSSLVLPRLSCQIFFFKNWALVVNLIELFLSYVDEESVKAAHTRVTLLLTSSLTSCEVMISRFTVIPTIPAVTCTSANAIIRKPRAKTKVLMGSHRCRCLRRWENGRSLLSWFSLTRIGLCSLLLVSWFEHSMNTWSGSLRVCIGSTQLLKDFRACLVRRCTFCFLVT